MGWDRNHYLENLSGRATECGMIGKDGWNFKKEKSQAFNDFEWRVEGMFGSALNLGVTQPAMEEILDDMQPIMAKVQSNLVGCSVIPDCISGDQLYVQGINHSTAIILPEADKGTKNERDESFQTDSTMKEDWIRRSLFFSVRCCHNLYVDTVVYFRD